MHTVHKNLHKMALTRAQLLKGMITSKVCYSPPFANRGFLASSFADPQVLKRPCLVTVSSSRFILSKGPNKLPYLTRSMSNSTNSSLWGDVVPQNGAKTVKFLIGNDDVHGGVHVSLKEHMDSKSFASMLKSSMTQWREQGKKSAWIKLPIEFVHLVETAVKEGFRYHHAEPDYLMLVYWIPETINTLPVNASHRVGMSAFVMNSKREVLVVQENSGHYRGTGVWKFPTGVINEGEDICTAAVREVKEETGVETEFVEVLAFRQRHQAFFTKSDLAFVCMLHPLSLDIQKQDSEIEAAQWMPIKDYAAQPYVQEYKLLSRLTKICLARSSGDYTGFSPVSTATPSGETCYMYFNNRYVNLKD